MTSEGYEKNVRDARYTIYLMVSLGYGSFAAAILLVINKAGLLPEHSIVKYAVAFILSVAYIFIYFYFHRFYRIIREQKSRCRLCSVGLIASAVHPVPSGSYCSIIFLSVSCAYFVYILMELLVLRKMKSLR